MWVSGFSTMSLWIILLSSLSVAGCGDRDAAQTPANDVRQPSDQISRPESAVSAIDQEGIDKAWELFRGHWTQCAESWVSVQTGQGGWFRMCPTCTKQIVELKGVDIRPATTRAPVTEADRLNGMEWKGSLDFVFTAARTYTLRNDLNKEPRGPWSEWWAPSQGVYHISYRINLIKKAGQWIAPGPQNDDVSDPLGGEVGASFSALSCEQIEVLTKEASVSTERTVQPFKLAPDALCAAAMSGDVEAVKSAIAAGADVKGKWSKGLHPTPLIAAIKDETASRVEIVEMLLKAGADPNIADDGGQSPLTYAAMADSRRITKFLLDYGADVNRKGHAGLTALHVAVPHASQALIQLLLDAGADVNMKSDLHGQTPLQIATQDNRTEIVQMLIAHGAKQ